MPDKNQQTDNSVYSSVFYTEEVMKRVSFDKIRTSGFWKYREDLNREVSIPSVYDRFKETGRIDAVKCLWKEGDENKPHIFWDSDVAKWIESAAYSIALNPDEELEKKIDAIVDDIGKNQMPDGYFNSYYLTVEPGKRFTVRDNHELYCAGHLIEAAIAYYNATGKDKLLKIMMKYVDLIIRIFVEEDSALFSTPGHEEIELALIKLYDCTGDKKYLDLCAHFINTRGTSKKDKEIPSWADQMYYQSDMPVRKFKAARGHSVRAGYLYCGMADLAARTGDTDLLDACERLFDNISQTQMYITGGVGSTAKGEAFAEEYLLPNDLAYSETCASIALAMFARRMSEITPKAKYDDVAELAMYNCVLSGVSLDGKSFFYVNPLEINIRRHDRNERFYDIHHNLLTQRIEVFGCSCCPPNLTRFIASIGDYLYTYDDSTVYVHHYMESEAEFDGVKITQQTRYPNHGEVRITVSGMKGRNLAVRIPGWTDFVSLNGEEIKAGENGYVTLPVTDENQVFDFWFNMDAKLVCANPEVEDDAGKVCVCRGPLVYCAESTLNDGIDLNKVSIESDLKAGLEFDEKMQTYKIILKAYEDMPSDALYRGYDPKAVRGIKLTMLPYFAFANNGESDMKIWMRTKHIGEDETVG